MSDAAGRSPRGGRWWRRRWVVSAVLIILAGIAGYLVGQQLGQDPTGRGAYRAYDPARDRWLAEFQAAYALAEQRGEAWIQDPITVGLRSAGYPNDDQVSPDQIRVWYPQAHRVTMIVFREGLRDDSVAARELRVELERVGGAWRLVWLGSRSRCVRDVTLGWTTGRCS